ncbi:hypothetical protein ACROYT_G039034 [Oculina patagonica]
MKRDSHRHKRDQWTLTHKYGVSAPSPVALVKSCIAHQGAAAFRRKQKRQERRNNLVCFLTEAAACGIHKYTAWGKIHFSTNTFRKRLLSSVQSEKPTAMKPQLIAVVFLVTCIISTHSFFLRPHGKRESTLHKKTSSRWNSAQKTRNLQDHLNKRLWSWREDKSRNDDTSNLEEMEK